MSYPTSGAGGVRNVYAYLTPELLARSARELDDLRRRQSPTPHFVVEEKPQEVFLSRDELREAFAPGGIRERFQQAVDDALAVRRAEQRILQLASLRLPEDGIREVAFLVARALGGAPPETGYTPARPLAEAVIKSPRGQFTHNLRITNG